MHRDELARIIEQYELGKIGREALLDLLASPGFTDLGHTKVDTSRPFRTGYPEAVYCRGKTVE
ncbi:MAG: 1-(5-phosphoribosyl)-5-amino-4-imidazole-carboxylate carboxylase, partial [Spirochaetota bacterium]